MVLDIENGRKFFDKKLLFHIKKGEYDNVVSILKDVDVKNLVDSKGMTLLHHTVAAQNAETVKYLIGKGCEIDAVDAYGNTPLLNAMKILKTHPLVFMHVGLDNVLENLIQVLLDSNADILFCGQKKKNPLQIALALDNDHEHHILIMFFEALKRKCSADSRQMAKILLDADCRLYQAVFLRDPIVTEHMLDAGRSINDPDYLERTALHYSVKEMDVDNVKLLLERRADIGAKDMMNRTPSFYYPAGRAENCDMLKILLNHDRSLNPTTDRGYEFVKIILLNAQLHEVELLFSMYHFDFGKITSGQTLLHVISKNTNPGVIGTLEGKEFEVDGMDCHGRTALFYAAESCNPNALEFLLKHGANPNCFDRDRESALFLGFQVWVLHEPTMKNSLKCLELLLEYGADVFVLFENYRSHRIIDTALQSKHFALVETIIGQVALLEATRQTIEGNVLEILGKGSSEKFLSICRHKIGTLKKTMINETISVFQFLVEPEEKLLAYVRSPKSADTLQQIIYKERDSNIFLVKILCKRAQNILEIAKLREKASLIISIISECTNWDVIYKIGSFLDKKSLQNLCEIQSDIVKG